MPRFSTNTPQYKKQKESIAEWSNFRRGLNLLFRPTELRRDEMSQADNIMLVGSGVPTGRWGTVRSFVANATGSIRGFGSYVSNDKTTNEVFVLTDQGYLAKKDSLSYTTIAGQSYPSGTTIKTEQLGGKTYIVSKDVSFTSYDGSNLVVFSTISAPTGVYATNFSGATGPNQVSYKVVAIGANGGQTTPSTNYVLSNLPTDLTKSQYHLFWSAPSAATISGYEIYRGSQGDETLLASVDAAVTRYVDSGEAASPSILAPITNTTGGVKSNFIVKYKDRLLVVPADDPNKLMISGRYPNHTKFSWADGGGYIYIDPDSGDNITGIAVQPIADRIVIYKENSSYLVELSITTIANYAVLDPQYQPISTSVGCSNHATIQTVENDTFYFGRKGLYVTGYEPNFLNIIRTNETSARIRPYLDLLNDEDYRTACALYVNNKYILSFPQRREMVVYDRERGAFLGIWKLPFGISHMFKHIDSSGTEKWFLGSNSDNIVYEFSTGSNTDDGEAIVKTIRTNKESFGDWTVLSIVNFCYFLFRSLVGSTTVNILVEDRNGATSNVKTFTITGAEVGGSTGWGMDQWGLAPYGLTNVNEATTVSDEVTRWGTLFKQARYVQLEVASSASNSNFEWLGAKVTSNQQSRGALSSSQRV
jgi:hypothetical protein